MKRNKLKIWQKLLFLGVMLLLTQQIFSQVKGKVSDEKGLPLPGVTIIEKGTTNGVITDPGGLYQIKVQNGQTSILIFSFVGMKTQEIPVKGETTLNVTLKEELKDIDEVVVVGYGTQKKESIVAAISTISAEDIVRTPTANLTAGLAGKLPGLTIMIKDGELGKENIQTYIRGQATTNTSNPLILVDGVEREITTLEPYDIESVSILKDASATAVFGVRGANGVILVTTKKGIVGKPQISGNVNYSLQTPTRLPKPMNAIDYMNTRNGVIQDFNDALGQSSPLPYSDEDFEHYRKGDLPEYYVDRNFFKELMYKFVPMYKGNVNIRGGSTKTKYFVSAGYMRQGGPFKTERWDEYNYDNEQRVDRFTYRTNIEMQITKSLKAWLNLSGYLQDKNDPIIYGSADDAGGEGSYYYLLLAAFLDIPTLSFPDVNSDGNVVSVPGTDRTPYGMLNRSGYRITTTNTVNSTLGIEQQLDFLTKGLSARAIISYDSWASHIRGFSRVYQTYVASLDESGGTPVITYSSGDGKDTELSPVLTQRFRSNYDLEASLNYNRSFNNHNVSGLLLYKQNQRIVNVEVPYNYVGIVGRATYAYRQKYLAEFNFGMNGSEQFAPGHRFGFFPSVSLGWVLTEEPFMKSVNGVQFLKLRGSFGQVGNDQISGSRFIYVDDYTQGYGGYFNGLNGLPGLPDPVYEKSMPNELVTWEVSNKFNIGFESRFSKGFEWDVDLFYEKRNSILIDVASIPAYMYGQLALPSTNDGIMSNRGFETTFGYSTSVSKDLFLGARFSASFARNKVEKMNETPLDETYAYQYKVEGFSRGVNWGYDCLGYFEDQAEIEGWADQTGLGAQTLPGDLKYRDVNGDGAIDPKDLVPMKYPGVPELNMALNLTAQYKGFDFNVLFQGVSNYTFNFSGRGIYDWDGGIGGIKTYFDHHRYSWTPERAANHEEIRYPRMHPDGISGNKQASDYWLIDLAYLRIKNLELGYTLPKRWSSCAGIENFRIYLNGSNLLTIDNMPEKILDPEVSNSLNHPIFKTYNIGLNITF